MPVLKLTFDSSVNVSAQEGDVLYFCNTTNNQADNNQIYKLGTIIDISRTPFLHAVAGRLSATPAGATYSTINFYTVNNGIDDNMNIECVVSGSTETPPVLARDVLQTGSTINNVNHAGALGTSCRTSLPALDTVGGHNYYFRLTTPGVTTLEVDMTQGDYNTYFAAGCSPCVTTSSFLLFSKDNDVNLSSMLGYYADVEFRNFSENKVELFTVGAECTQSSK